MPAASFLPPAPLPRVGYPIAVGVDTIGKADGGAKGGGVLRVRVSGTPGGTHAECGRDQT